MNVKNYDKTLGSYMLGYIEQPIELHDIPVEENPDAYAAFRDAYGKNLPHKKWSTKAYCKFKSFIRRLLYVDCW